MGTREPRAIEPGTIEPGTIKPGTIELGAPPAIAPLYVKAALGVLPRGRLLRGGLPGARRSRARRPRELPDTALVLPDQIVDRDHLAAYARVCGFPVSDRLPVTYPHVLAFGLALRLMTGRDFPFPLLGLVHIRNRIVAHRAICADERITLGVRASGLGAHARGSQFVLTTEATVDGDVTWSEESTYLRRSGAGRPRGTANTVLPEPTVPPEPTQLPEPIQLPEPTAVWRLAEDAGRRYAAVSGDYNPIHLHRLAARAFGFPRAIAHGMYTTAQCLAALDPRLPGAYTADVRFGRPLLLPATVQVSVTGVSGGWSIAVHNPDGRPHLTGTISPDGYEPGADGR